MDGLWTTCNIYEKVAADDGFGGVEDRLDLVAANVPCRKTTLTETERMNLQGQGSSADWRISTEYVSGLQHEKHYAIRLAREET